MSPLYHYCSIAAFHSIITTRTIWLSSLRQSNDKSEGRMLSEAFTRLAESHKVSKKTKANLLLVIRNLEGLWEALGFCLSIEGDLLSQWRSYAEDGTGVSIGFNRHYLDWLVDSSKELNLSLKKVEYEIKAHDHLALPVFKKLKELLESDDDFLEDIPPEIAPDSPEYARLVHLRGRIALLTLIKAAMPLIDNVFCLKHGAFSEEKEWRLLHSYGWLPENPCNFRPSSKHLIQYKECVLQNSNYQPFVRLVLGPKNTTPIPVVENFLLQYGFKDVDVVRSGAPYR